MLERAVEVAPHLIGGTDGCLTHDAGLAGGVQLVVLEVHARIRCLVLAVEEADGGFLAWQLRGCRSRTVVARGLVHHDRDDWLLSAAAHHPTWTRAGSGDATAGGPPRGSITAAQSPTSPIPARLSIAAAYAPLLRPATRMVPATAVPIDDPRLEMLRDSPEISPCMPSLKLDCTRLTEGVSIAPRPKPVRKSPGARPQALVVALAPISSTAMPTIVVTNPAMMRVRWARLFANRSAAREEINMPAVAAVKMTPVWIA